MAGETGTAHLTQQHYSLVPGVHKGTATVKLVSVWTMCRDDFVTPRRES